MADKLDVIEIIQSRTAQGLVSHVETRWADDIDRHTQTRGKAQDRAGVLGDVGLIQRKSHTRRASHCLGWRAGHAPNCP